LPIVDSLVDGSRSADVDDSLSCCLELMSDGFGPLEFAFE